MPEIYRFCPQRLRFSVRKQGLHKYAEMYLQIMKDKFEMQPCVVTYTEMLCCYAKSFQKEKAMQLFAEYQQRSNGLAQKNETIYGAYLNVFGRLGDIEGMERVINEMETIY